MDGLVRCFCFFFFFLGKTPSTFDAMDQSVSLWLGSCLFRKDTLWWTSVCLLIYLAGIVMPLTRVCLLKWCISNKKKHQYDEPDCVSLSIYKRHQILWCRGPECVSLSGVCILRKDTGSEYVSWKRQTLWYHGPDCISFVTEFWKINHFVAHETIRNFMFNLVLPWT